MEEDTLQDMDMDDQQDMGETHAQGSAKEQGMGVNEQQEMEAIEPAEVEDEHGEGFASAEPIPLGGRQARFRKLWMLNKFSS